MKTIVFLTVLGIVFASVLPQPALAQQNLKIFGVSLGCDPSKAPNPNIDPNIYGPSIPGCGLDHFAYLIKIVINFVAKVIVLPLAVLMIIWGGFKIMTAAGNTSQFAEGRKIITTALIGVAIVFGAGIIVSLVWSLLSPNAPPVYGPMPQ